MRDINDVTHCEKCSRELNGETAYMDHLDEIWCHPCADNAAESAWERHCSSYYGGGGPATLQQQMIDAKKLK